MNKNVTPNSTFRNAILTPFQEFFKLETASGIILLVSAVVAVIWANSAWSEQYYSLLASPVTFGFGSVAFSTTIIHIINDGLMTIFFFVVGLEIKREMLVGELSSPKQAALPIFAAIGGMLLPALFYWMLNQNGDGIAGWGIPMATDIAFAIGMLALLGKRVPAGLKVMLTALAIIDDIGAVLVIAVFYTSELSLSFLLFAGLIIVMLSVLNWKNVRSIPLYLGLGVLLWFFLLQSGVHATIAGIVLAMTIPASTRVDQKEFVERGRLALADFSSVTQATRHSFLNRKQLDAIHSLLHITKSVLSPMQLLDTGLHKTVIFFIMPIFALANAGVNIGDRFLPTLLHPVTIGTSLGLIVGKVIGIALFSLMAVKLGIAVLPQAVKWIHIIGVGFLGGIGFTMSLFIANLAFPSGSNLDAAKVGIICGSLVSGLLGGAFLWWQSGRVVEAMTDAAPNASSQK